MINSANSPCQKN